MAITHDPDFSPAIAQLVNSFSRCADGHTMTDVIEAAANMLSASLHNYGRAAGMSDEKMMALAEQACNGIRASVKSNFKRQGKPTDLVVKVQ